MPFKYTADEILESLRNLVGTGSTGATGSEDSDLLRHVNEALREKILAEVAGIREDYFVKRERATVPASLHVRIPTRAMWGKLRDLWWIDTSGSRIPIDPIDMADLDAYVETTGFPAGFYLEDQDVVLVSGGAGGQLEQAFLFRPGQLVLQDSARLIVSVTPGSKTIVLDDNVPESWGIANRFDVHSPESGAEMIDWGLSATVVSGNLITFTTEIDGTLFGKKALAVGQWLCLEGEAAIPGIPIEWHPLLVRAAAARWVESLGDKEMVQTHGGVAEKLTDTNLKQAEQRVESKPLRIGRRRSALGAMRGRSPW